MSPSGYGDDADNWAMIRWRGAVASAIRGRHGQAFLQEMIDALDALPEKRLIAGDLIREGEVCALGAVGLARGMEMGEIDPEDPDSVADAFALPISLACEIEYLNDEFHYVSPEERFERMRLFAVRELAKTWVYKNVGWWGG